MVNEPCDSDWESGPAHLTIQTMAVSQAQKPSSDRLTKSGAMNCWTARAPRPPQALLYRSSICCASHNGGQLQRQTSERTRRLDTPLCSKVDNSTRKKQKKNWSAICLPHAEQRCSTLSTYCVRALPPPQILRVKIDVINSDLALGFVLTQTKHSKRSKLWSFPKSGNTPAGDLSEQTLRGPVSAVPLRL